MEERLQKYISASGLMSRREAEDAIRNGDVKVNGKVITELGFKVNDDDIVEVDSEKLKRQENKVYYMLNKPAGFITSLEDERGRRTVMDLIDLPDERIYPVGRLDYNTSGLLLLTNDGELANHITHPSGTVEKTYVAEVKGFFHISDAQKLKRGVDIGDKYPTAPADIEIIRQTDSTSTVVIKIHEGRNRQVRRMMEAVGHDVVRLERTAIGNLRLGHLKTGRYRKLSDKEIEYLRSL